MPQILRLFLLNTRIVLVANKDGENSIYKTKARASKNSKKAPRIHGNWMPFYWFRNIELWVSSQRDARIRYFSYKKKISYTHEKIR